jgi:N-acetylmuramoyl-L-alanine amidase
MGGRHLMFTLGSPTVIVDRQPNRAVNLPRPIMLRDGLLYAPAAGVANLLSEYTGRECEFLPEQGWLNYGGTGLNILGIQMTDRPGQGTEVEILLTEPLAYESFSEGEGWLHITFAGARADVAALTRTRCVGLVRRLEVFEEQNILQISFKLSRRYNEQPEFYPTADGLLLSLRRSAAGERIDTSSPNPVAPRRGIQTVVIDPGHGGQDPGSIGPTGLQEKDVVLDVALRLRELIQRDPRTSDIEVVMTRETDDFPELAERYEIANERQGDLFISIHANGFDNPSANGFMTFFLSEARNDESRQVATLENSVVRFEENSRALQLDSGEPMLRGILGELISTKFLEESQVLAGLVQDELIGRIRHQVQPRRLDQAGFMVLNGASMPSVLVEIAFITNRAEENFLRQNSFKNRVAEALHEAIVKYIERVEGGR